jgi:hypothetical protein
MELWRVLKESLTMLKGQPRLFLPRFISTGISSLWLLGFLESMNQPIFYLLTTPFIVVLGVFVSVMLAEMVKIREEPGFLKRSFLSTSRMWKKVLGTSLVFLLTSFIFSLPASGGLIFYRLTGNPLGLLGILVSFIAVIAMSFAVYFLPISLVEKSGVFQGFADSARTSFQNSREVTLLLLLSLGLLGTATFSQGALEGLGYAGFIAGRMVSAMVTTYLFVVSPEFYMRKKEGNED